MPIVKKEGEKVVDEYRGVTLIPTLYKVYVGSDGKIKKTNRRKENNIA